MERIGIAASKIAKGNLFLYNFFVILLSALFSLIVFFITGSAIVVVLTIVAYVSSSGGAPDLEMGWMSVMLVALICLFIIVAIFNIAAVAKNFRLRKI